MRVYHLAPASEWERAKREGSYRPPSLAREGFIHCSTAEQLRPVADALFRGHSGLVLLCIDAQRVRSPLRWEPPAAPPGMQPPPELGPEARLPHLYGPLDLDAVVEAHPVELASDGRLSLPDDTA